MGRRRCCADSRFEWPTSGVRLAAKAALARVEAFIASFSDGINNQMAPSDEFSMDSFPFGFISRSGRVEGAFSGDLEGEDFFGDFF